MLIAMTFWFFVFAVFHSITAHEFFKNALEKFFGGFFVEHFWRLIYCLLSFYLLYYAAYPYLYRIETFQWLVEYPEWLWNLAALVKISGGVLMYWGYLQLDPFEFWGFKQAYRGLRLKMNGERTADLPIKLAGVTRLEVKGVYHVVRHPMLAGGFLFVIGSPPLISTLSYAVLYFAYMVIGAYFEERRLIAHFGDDYLRYKKEVGAFFPNVKQWRAWARQVVHSVIALKAFTIP